MLVHVDWGGRRELSEDLCSQECAWVVGHVLLFFHACSFADLQAAHTGNGLSLHSLGRSSAVLSLGLDPSSAFRYPS